MSHEKESISGWNYVGAFISGGIILTAVALGCIGLFGGQNTKAENALASYDSAVKLCGTDNTQEHVYQDGSKDFDCADYSLVK